jgi:hypothetical protein
MPLYRVIINNQDIGEYVTATSSEDAYTDIATSIPLRYDDQVQIIEMPAPQAKTNLSAGDDTIQSST